MRLIPRAAVTSRRGGAQRECGDTRKYRAVRSRDTSWRPQWAAVLILRSSVAGGNERSGDRLRYTVRHCMCFRMAEELHLYFIEHLVTDGDHEQCERSRCQESTE